MNQIYIVRICYEPIYFLDSFSLIKTFIIANLASIGLLASLEDFQLLLYQTPSQKKHYHLMVLFAMFQYL